MSALWDLSRDLMSLQAGAAEGPPLTPTERTAASEALRRQDQRIAALERGIMTCANCGSLLVCPMCGHDPREERVRWVPPDPANSEPGGYEPMPDDEGPIPF